MNIWSLRKRIGVGFGLLCFTLLLLGGVAIARLRLVARQADEVSLRFTKQGNLAAEMLTQGSNLAIAARGYDITSTAEQWKQVEADLAQTDTAIRVAQSFSQANPSLVGLRDGLEQAGPIFVRYRTSLEQFRVATANFEQTWNSLVPAGGRLFEALCRLADKLEAVSGGGSASAAAQMRLLTHTFRDAAETRMSCWRVVGTGDPQHAVNAHANAIAAAEKLTQIQTLSRAPEVDALLAEAIGILTRLPQLEGWGSAKC